MNKTQRENLEAFNRNMAEIRESLMGEKAKRDLPNMRTEYYALLNIPKVLRTREQAKRINDLKEAIFSANLLSRACDIPVSQVKETPKEEKFIIV